MRQFIRRVLRPQSGYQLRYNFSKNLESQSLEYQQEGEQSKQDSFQQQLDMQANINEYQLGLKFMDQGKHRLAYQFFQRVRSYQENNEILHGDGWLRVSQKMALALNQLRLYEDCEQALEGIIENNQKYSVNEAILYESYNNLFIHCLKTNLDKAILLGKALLCEEEKQKIPLAYQKQFIFNLGTAYLLNENYGDAKLRLRECLISEPNALLKGFALNNLAVASWLHKMPNFVNEDIQGSITQQDETYSDDQIDQDFKYVIPLLKRSIKSIQSVEGDKDDKSQTLMDLLLDESVLTPNESLNYDDCQLNQKQCGTALLNMSEFLFNTDSKKRQAAQFWFKYTTKFFEKNDANNMDRCLILLAWLCSSTKEYERANELFQRTLEMVEANDSYNKVLCLQLYGTMLKQNPDRIVEGEKLIALAITLAENLPTWSNKLVHVLIPEMEL